MILSSDHPAEELITITRTRFEWERISVAVLLRACEEVDMPEWTTDQKLEYQQRQMARYISLRNELEAPMK